LEKRKFIDVVFVVDGQEIFAHKIVLYLSDAGFKSIFKENSGTVSEFTLSILS